MKKLTAILFVLVALALCGHAAEYQIIDLGTLGEWESFPYAMNDAGQVVGESLTTTFRNHAFLWTPGEGMIDLDTPGGERSCARAINNAGQVAGWATTADGERRAFLWTPGEGMLNLGTLGGSSSTAFGINSAGQVVGSSTTVDGDSRAFLWLPEPAYELPAGMNDLGTLGGDSSAVFINDAGQVAGSATTATGEQHAFLWTPSEGMVDLGTLGGDYASCSGLSNMNNAGQVSGVSATATGQWHAFVWTAPDGMRDLGTPDGERSFSSGLNEAGQAVGWWQRPSGQYHAFLWTPEEGMRDLGTLGGTDSFGLGISNAGQVMGQSRTASGARHAFLWTRSEVMIDLSTLGGTESQAWLMNSSGQILGDSETADGGFHACVWVPIPSVVGIQPSSGPPGSQGLITGESFGTTVGSVRFTAENGTDMDWAVLSWTSSEIAFRVPVGTPAGPGLVSVVRPDGWATGGLAFEVLGAPVTAHVDDDNTTGTEDGSESHPFNTIQEAVDAVANGGTVKVAQGTYTSAADNVVSVQGKTVYLRGGYVGGSDYGAAPGDFDDGSRDWETNVTTIDGQNARRCVRLDQANGELSGFTITNGHASGAYPNGQGGGVYCVNGSPTITKNVIMENFAQSGGGGIYCAGQTAAATISNNTISRNSSGAIGGGIRCDAASPRITNNTVTANGFHGIVCMYSCSPVIANNTITANQNNGIDCTQNASPEVTNNTISANGGGGVSCSSASPTITNNSISGNLTGGVWCVHPCTPTITNNTITANRHVGITINNSSPTVANNTIAGNTWGIYCYEGSSPTITNCIVWGNGTELYGCSVTYSCIEGGSPGTGNIDADPLFADPANGDYHLRSRRGRYDPSTGLWVTDLDHSPCIDTGDPASAVGDEPSPNGGRINMGAYGGTDQASKSTTPVLASIEPQSGPPVCQGLITGSDFDSLPGTVTFISSSGAALEWEVLSWSNAQIAFRVPAGTPVGLGQVKVVRANAAETQSLPFQVTHPDVVCVDDDNTTGIENGTEAYPFDTIQEGVDAVAGGGIVKVAQGTYTGTTDNVVSIQSKTVYLRGGYVGGDAYAATAGNFGDDDHEPDLHVTTVDGENSRRCVLLRDANGEISGFHVTNGSADSNGGGGLSLIGSSPLVANNTIRGNQAIEAWWSKGGGVRLGPGSGAILAGNLIEGNTAIYRAGGVSIEDSSPTLTGNTIRGNTSQDDAGGIFIHTGAPTLTGNTIVDNTAATDGGGLFIRLSAATLVGNTIAGNKTATCGGGLFVLEASPLVEQNSVYGNLAGADGGGLWVQGSALLLRSNSIESNSAVWEGGGVCLVDVSSGELTSNHIAGNHAALGGGITTRRSSPATFVNNTITANGSSGVWCDASSPAIINNTITANSQYGIYSCHDASPVITNCILWGNGDDLCSCVATYSCVEDGDPGTGNIDADPLFADPANGDYHLRSRRGRYDPSTGLWVTDLDHSPCIDTGDPASAVGDEPSPNSGRVNMGAYGGTAEASKGSPVLLAIEPASGPPCSHGIITGQSFGPTVGAVKFAPSGGAEVDFEVVSWSDAQISFRVPAGTPLGLGQVKVVRSDAEETSTVAFTITDPVIIHVDDGNTTGTEDGSARYPFNTIQEAVGAVADVAVVKVAQGNYTFGELLIENKTAYLRGGYVGGTDYATAAGNFDDASRHGDPALTVVEGAVWVKFKYARGEVSGFTLRNGMTGILCEASSPTITNNTVSGNGGGIQCIVDSSPTIANNTIMSNQNWDIYCSRYCSPTVANNTIGGSGNCGILLYYFCSPAITNNTISGKGVGIRCMVYVYPRITNCILWGNGNDLHDEYTPTATYSCIEDGDAGEGNIAADPLFVDPANGDYRLQAGSPCIDVGNTAALPADATDLDGDGDTTEPIPFDLDGAPRVVGEAVDMGAYEMHNTPPTAEAGGPYDVDEGGSVTVTASGSDPEGGELTFAWDLDNDGTFETLGQSATFSAAVLDGPSSHTIAVRVTDPGGLTATAQTTVEVQNVAPTVAAANPTVIVDEAQTASNTGTFGDPGDDTVTLSSSIGSVTDSGNGTWNWSYLTSDGPSQSQTVVITATDSDGGTSQATFVLTVSNVAPSLEPITAPIDPVPVGMEVAASANFTDPGVLDTHTGTWSWGDGNEPSNAIVAETDGCGSATGTHIYNTPGVYTLTLTVTDKDGGSEVVQFLYVVVYDPCGGSVTGGGWIMSPLGAYRFAPTLVGKASFGFTAKYHNGADIPDGETQFRFKVADLTFHSTVYQWLVVAGARAQFKGTGRLNGEDGYGFMLTAIDGQINGGGGTDSFRIKIWNGDGVVYDNKVGEADDSSAATEIGGGSIVIHKE